MYCMTFIERRNGIDIHYVFLIFSVSNAKIEQRPSSGIYSPTFGKYRCTLFCYLSGLKGAHDAKIGQHVGACRYIKR